MSRACDYDDDLSRHDTFITRAIEEAIDFLEPAFKYHYNYYFGPFARYDTCLNP